MKNTKELVIKTSAGGLGDHLRLTTIPELASNNGFECYLDESNNYSNKNIFDVVWKNNPFIKGVKKSADALDLTDAAYRKIMEDSFYKSKLSFIENIEMIYGFHPTNKTPKLYFSPQNFAFLNDKVLVDLNCKTHFYHYQLDMETFLPLLIQQLKPYKPHEIVVLEIPGIDNFNKYIPCYEQIPTKNKLFSNSLKEAADILCSVKYAILLHSGSSSLSCALNKPSTTLIRDTEYNYYKKCWNNWLFEPTAYKVFESHIKA